jgi:NAD(P)-dependent dehydrogenase (short-subunit alcohol dehydrogenase family)
MANVLNRQKSQMNEFTSKVAFVTGAGSGIGRASALKLATQGAKVMAMDLDAAGLAETADLAGEGVGEMAIFVGDVCDAAAVKAAIAECVARFGGLHLAHNNAGIVGTSSGPIASFSAETFQQVMNVNVMGVFHCLQAELAHMLASGGGAIVNTASVVGRVVLPDICAYVTSKHAVVGLTKAAAVENAAKGVRVNCVSPGYVITNMTKNFFTEESLAAFVGAHPIGRGAQPEEIADAALYLLSDRASFITGADLTADGGYTLM